ncbi:MAG: GIY-YIG nuclease family protein, partial [Armatimonadota bacterium]
MVETPSEQGESRGTVAMRDSRPWHFYLVRCADGSLYAGIALDPEKRAQLHNAGKGADYTARRRPVSLAYTQPHASKSAARSREMQVN